MSLDTTAGGVTGDPSALPEEIGGGPRVLAREALRTGLHYFDAVVITARKRIEAGRNPVDIQPSGVPAGDPPRGLVLRPALLGFAAMLCISIGASLPSSPFKLEMPGVWFFGEPSSVNGTQWGVYFTLAAVYGGLLLLMRVWWGMTRLYAPVPASPSRR